MPRITVTADQQPRARDDGAPVLMDEYVVSSHLSDDHAARQLVERLAWAISDAEEFEHAV